VASCTTSACSLCHHCTLVPKSQQFTANITAPPLLLYHVAMMHCRPGQVLYNVPTDSIGNTQLHHTTIPSMSVVLQQCVQVLHKRLALQCALVTVHSLSV
jgi:hypothetical protein